MKFHRLVVLQGIFAKAEALYCKGEFELALVFYHRGNKLRPELQEFRLGIQKAKEAIDNAVGSKTDFFFKFKLAISVPYPYIVLSYSIVYNKM